MFGDPPVVGLNERPRARTRHRYYTLPKLCLHTPYNRTSPPAQYRMLLPGQVIVQQPHRFDTRATAELAQRRQPPQRPPTEQILAVPPHGLLGQHPTRYRSQAERHQ